MNAIVLAAGLGTRLRPLGLNTPKILVEIGGEPLLAHQLRFLADAGVEKVVVNMHDRAAVVDAYIRTYDGPLELVGVVEPTLLGTAGAVRNALQHLLPGPILVLYGDVIVREPVTRVVAAHAERRPAATLTAYEAQSTEGKGVVDVDHEGWVRGFREKASRGPGLVNAGLYVVEPELIEPLPLGEPRDFGHDVFPKAVDGGRKIFCHRLSEPVIDVGTPPDLLRARDLFAAR